MLEIRKSCDPLNVIFKDWISRGIHIAHIKCWMSNNFSLDEALSWLKCGFEIDDAMRFKEEGLTPVEAKKIVIETLKEECEILF